MNVPAFNQRSRLLLFAPHPDDESLACSIILQRATRANAAIRVVYATDGENNPWPQRVLEKKWRLSQVDRAAWGRRRRTETLAALNRLGVPCSNVQFLGLPDQGLTKLLLLGCAHTFNRLAQCIIEWAPTDILWPDISDIHPDHSALGVMLRLVLQTLPRKIPPVMIWNFLVHGHSPHFFQCAVPIRQSSSETATKKAAINCHQTQLKLSRRRFMEYAGRPESFARWELSRSPRRTVLDWGKTEDEMVVSIAPMSRRLLCKRPNLLIVGCDSFGDIRSVSVPVDLHGRISKMFEPAVDEWIGTVRSEGTLFSGLQMTMPASFFAPDRGIYLKVARRGFFFDEAGWIDAAEAADEASIPDIELKGELSFAIG